MRLRIHYDNYRGFHNPYLVIGLGDGSDVHEYQADEQDHYGFVYDITADQPAFQLRFKDGSDDSLVWEDVYLLRDYVSHDAQRKRLVSHEIWCRGFNAFIYTVEPRKTEAQTSADFLNGLSFKSGIYIPNSGGRSGLGANILADGRILFGFFHPSAARVYLAGDFNGWQYPGVGNPNSSQFIEMKLYRGYFDMPNIWLTVIDYAQPRQQYKFFIQGGVPHDTGGQSELLTIDPYARQISQDQQANNAVIIDPSGYKWGDTSWKTPLMSDLILYELSVYGFTQGDTDIPEAHQGKFTGITDRIKAGYFHQVGASALSVMPVNEFPTPMGSGALGYNPSLYFAPERDFGAPDDYRAMVDIAHQHGLAVISDQVFNHTSNDFNPLWKLILEHPREEMDPTEGGLYFSGITPWGNRVATERTETQNMLIDVCKTMVVEYHMDGFRFDFTHSSLMHHDFLNRLADELQAIKTDVILIAENMPNESDLNRQGFNGYAQWSNDFHDGIKALLREGEFEGKNDDPQGLGNIFYFSKSVFASHTNNVVNYCESHDEHSVSHEIESTPTLDSPAAKERKGRLGLFATMVALGQPMIYMGQEFNAERPRNVIDLDWPANLDEHGYFQWASRLMCLRRRYPGLRLSSYDPAADGLFTWIVGHWLEGKGLGQKVIGWRSCPNDKAYDRLVVLLNFESHSVEVDLDFGLPGMWVRLATIDAVNDIAPEGSNSAQDETAIRTTDGRFDNFVLPDSSGFIYKWEAPE
jgi:1,4-alpha-glucan branching enzyme